MKPAFELPDDWFVENDGQRLVLDPEKVKAAFEARVALQGWQPIESAPENENVLICGYGPAGYYVADAKKINGCWMLFDPPCDTHSYESYGHSHWQPLPPPPAASDREERRPPPKEKP